MAGHVWPSLVAWCNFAVAVCQGWYLHYLELNFTRSCSWQNSKVTKVEQRELSSLTVWTFGNRCRPAPLSIWYSCSIWFLFYSLGLVLPKGIFSDVRSDLVDRVYLSLCYTNMELVALCWVSLLPFPGSLIGSLLWN